MGRFDMLKDCLESLDQQEVESNIVIIDIASDPEERIASQEVFEGRNAKRIQQNVGFPRAANEGARMGSAPLIIFVSDDVILHDGTLDKMIRTMDDPTIGICGAKLMFPLTSTHANRPAGKIQHVGLALNIRGEIIHPLVGWSADNLRCCVSRNVFATTGACYMIRRELFNKAGGFDQAFGLGTYEDADLCLKIRSMGLRVFLNAEAKAYHYVGGSSEKKKIGFPLQQNSMIFKSRWLNTPHMTWDEWVFF
jgi:hypothetical protein